MTSNRIWLWSAVQSLFHALDESRFRVDAFVAYPPVFGSWHIDLVRGLRVYRIVADGKERHLTVQSGSTADEWKDIQTLSPEVDHSWIDEVVKTLERNEV